MSAAVLELFAPAENASQQPITRSEYVWVTCSVCGGELECVGIRDIISHARSCAVAALERC